MNSKNILISLVVVAILVAIGFALSNQKAQGQNIKMAFVGPLTGDGAVWGEIEKNSIELAAGEINAAGGVNGKYILPTYEDGKCTGKDSLAAAQKLISVDKVKILLVSCSQEVLPIAPVAEKYRVLVFASYAASSQISNAGDYVFRNAYSNADIARVASDVVGKNQKKLGIITEVTEYAADLRDVFKKHFEATGGTVFEENFSPGEKDVRTQVTNILNKNPEAIFVNPTGPATGLPILKQLKELGYKGTIYGNFFGSSREMQQAPEADGMIFFADPTVADSEIKKRFFDKYKEVYGEFPDLEYPAVARYDAVYILKQAIEAVGDDPTKIKDYLYTMKDFTGALGTYRFDKNGDVVGIDPAIKQIKNKEVINYTP